LIITDNNGQIPTNSYCFVVRRPQGAAPILWGNPGLGQETIAIHIGSIIFEFGNCSEVRLEVISRDVVHGFPVFTAVVSNIILGPEDAYIESLDDIAQYIQKRKTQRMAASPKAVVLQVHLLCSPLRKMAFSTLCGLMWS